MSPPRLTGGDRKIEALIAPYQIDWSQFQNVEYFPHWLTDTKGRILEVPLRKGKGALVSGTDGVTVGVFAWADAEGKVSNKKTAGARIGFVHREQQASITAYLAEHGNQILPGQIITLAVAGDFWAHFPAGAEIGQNVFAKDTDGTLKASASATETGHTLTRFKVASKAAAGEQAKITTWE